MVLKNNSMYKKAIFWNRVHHISVVVIIVCLLIISAGLVTAYNRIDNLDTRITAESELIESYYKCLNDIKDNTKENKENLIKIRDNIAKIKRD